MKGSYRGEMRNSSPQKLAVSAARLPIRNADLILEGYVYEDGYVHRGGIRGTNVEVSPRKA